jgi:hypothetical protein
MNNTKKRTITNKEGGFNSSKATPRKVATPREVQEHQEKD